MKDVVIYTKSWCGYCTRAKALLSRKGTPFK
jgi:glutaredoxin